MEPEPYYRGRSGDTGASEPQEPYPTGWPKGTSFVWHKQCARWIIEPRFYTHKMMCDLEVGY